MRDELGPCPPPAEDRGAAQLLTDADLTPTERRLCEFAAEGGRLDLSTGRLDDDDPAQGQTWEAHRQIRSQLLYQLLTGRGGLDACFGPPRAIRVRGALVIASLDLSDLDLRCPLELSGCHLNGVVNLEKTKAPDVSLAGSYLSGALLARRLCLTHDLDLGGATLRAAVNLDGANIGGAFDCSGAQLRNDSGPALYAARLTVGASVFLRDRFTATGGGERGAVRLLGANISGPLDCRGAVVTTTGRLALDLSEAKLGPLLLSKPMLDSATWSVDLSGTTYQGIPRPASLDQWLVLLRSHTPSYSPQPWQQLAAVHRAAGHERDARRILIAQQDDRRRRLLRPGPHAGWRTRAGLALYRSYLKALRLVVGYGYQTWRALIGLLVILVAGAGLGLGAGHTRSSPTQYVATHTRATASPGTACSAVEQVGLGVDLSLPVIKTNTRARCDLDSTSRPGQWFTVGSWILLVLSWAAATLVVAGYTGVVRRT